MICNYIDEKTITKNFQIIEINLFSYKQISQSNQRVEFDQKTSSFFNQKCKNQTKIKTILINEI